MLPASLERVARLTSAERGELWRMSAILMRLLALWPLALCPTAAVAGEHILTIAGGYNPSGNQVSLEKNVVFFRNVLERVGLGDVPHDVYFSNGESGQRDLQFSPGDDSVPRAQKLMAQIFGTTKYQGLEYRKHELEDVAAMTPENIAKWFDESAKQLKADDRLIIYATCHGGKSNNKAREGDTTLYMWDKKTVSVNQLQTHLEKVPEGVEIFFMMAQCYSGGFSNAIFKDANPEGEDFSRPVSGFFSTVQSRVAAGCTPDIDEADYDEFSSHFWAALNGETRVGDKVGNVDYNGDGKVDFEEAFAYTNIVSKNIDIPIKTSGAYLRGRSKYRREQRENEALLSQKCDYSKVVELARPSELAILDALSEQLGFTSEQRYIEAEEAADKIEKRRTELQRDLNAKKKEQDALKKTLQSRLRERWPELANILSPTAIQLMTTDADEFVKEAEAQSEFKKWTQLNSEREQISSERFQLEKKWAHHVRFMRTHNNIVLAKNLLTLGDQDAIVRYDEIVAGERGTLK